MDKYEVAEYDNHESKQRHSQTKEDDVDDKSEIDDMLEDASTGPSPVKVPAHERDEAEQHGQSPAPRHQHQRALPGQKLLVGEGEGDDEEALDGDGQQRQHRHVGEDQLERVVEHAQLQVARQPQVGQHHGRQAHQAHLDIERQF